MKTAVRLAPESWLPGGTPDPLMLKHGALGAPVSRVDGPLKVQGQGALRRGGAVRRAGLRRAGPTARSPRGRIAELDTARGRGGARRRAGDDASQRAAHEAAAGVPVSAEGRGRRATCPSCRTTRSTGTASRSRSCSPRRRSRPITPRRWCASTYEAEPAVTAFDAAKRQAHPPATIMGEPPSVETGDAEAALHRRAVQGRPDLSHAALQPQRHRAACRDGRVGGRQARRP